MRAPHFFLQDILDACNRIDRFIGSLSLDDFSDDDKTLSAVRDQIMIIGEAVKQIPDEMKEKHQDIPWDEIAGMRDVLIHDYMGVDLKTVWKVLQKRLPGLKPLLKGLISTKKD